MAGELGGDFNPGGVDVFGIGQGQAGAAAAEETDEHLLELFLHPVEGLEEGGLHHAVQLGNDLTQIGVGLLQVVHLRGQVLVSLHRVLIFCQRFGIDGAEAAQVVFPALNLLFQVFGKDFNLRQVRCHRTQRQCVLPDHVLVVHEVDQAEVILNALLQGFQAVILTGDFKLRLRQHSFRGDDALLIAAGVLLREAELFLCVFQRGFGGSGLAGNVRGGLSGFRAFIANLGELFIHLGHGFLRGINAVLELLLFLLVLQPFIIILTQTGLRLGDGLRQHRAAHIPMLDLVLQVRQLHTVDAVLNLAAFRAEFIPVRFRRGDLSRGLVGLLFILFKLSGGVLHALLLEVDGLRQLLFLDGELIELLLHLVHRGLKLRAVGGLFLLTAAQVRELLLRGGDVICGGGLLFTQGGHGFIHLADLSRAGEQLLPSLTAGNGRAVPAEEIAGGSDNALIGAQLGAKFQGAAARLREIGAAEQALRHRADVVRALDHIDQGRHAGKLRRVIRGRRIRAVGQEYRPPALRGGQQVHGVIPFGSVQQHRVKLIAERGRRGGLVFLRDDQQTLQHADAAFDLAVLRGLRHEAGALVHAAEVLLRVIEHVKSGGDFGELRVESVLDLTQLAQQRVLAGELILNARDL